MEDLFKITRGYVLSMKSISDKVSDEKKYPVFSSQTKNDGLMGYFNEYLYENAITWTTDGANAGTVNYRVGKFYCTNVCGVLIEGKTRPNKMIAEALNRVAKNYVSYVGNPKLMNNVMSKIVISLPMDSSEQQKISEFFMALDDTIALHQRTLEKYQKLKISYLEKMFPKENEQFPELRFPNFTDAWEQRKLGEVVIIKDSARIPNSRWVTSGIPYIRSSDISNNDLSGVLFISNAIYEYYKSQTGSPEKGDVLFNGGGEIGKAILKQNSSPIYVQGGAILYARTSHSKSLLGIYLKVYFETNIAKTYIDIASAGGTIKHFTLKPAKNMPIFFPKIEEQTAIGNFFKQLDDTIALHRRNCIKFQNLKVAYLESIFSAKYIQNKDKNKNAWEQRKLGDISQSYSGGTPSVGISSFYGGSIPFIRSGEINDEKTELFLTEKGLRNSSAKLVKYGDILYALYGATSGEVNRSKINGAINQAILAIIPNLDYCAEFIAQWLRKNKLNIISTYLQGGQGNLSAEIVKNLQIILPNSKEEQTAIGNFFKQLDDTIALHQRFWVNNNQFGREYAELF